MTAYGLCRTLISQGRKELLVKDVVDALDEQDARIVELEESHRRLSERYNALAEDNTALRKNVVIYRDNFDKASLLLEHYRKAYADLLKPKENE